MFAEKDFFLSFLVRIYPDFLKPFTKTRIQNNGGNEIYYIQGDNTTLNSASEGNKHKYIKPMTRSHVLKPKKTSFCNG